MSANEKRRRVGDTGGARSNQRFVSAEGSTTGSDPQDARRAAVAARLRAFDKIVRDPKLPPLAVKVSWRVISRMNSCNESWPSAETIATEIGASVRGVRGAISALVREGHLSCRSGGGRAKSNLYRLPGFTVNTAAPFSGVASREPQKKAKTVKIRFENGEGERTKTVNSASPEPTHESLQESSYEAPGALGHEGRAPALWEPSSEDLDDARSCGLVVRAQWRPIVEQIRSDPPADGDMSAAFRRACDQQGAAKTGELRDGALVVVTE